MPTESPQPVPARPELLVGVAASDRIRAGFSWEWKQFELTPHSWRGVADAPQLDLLLVELANGAIPGWNQLQTVALLQWAKTANLTTAAWVTGGTDERGLAGRWLGLVSRVFLSQHHDLEAWRARYPDTNFETLLPAVQPRLQNPSIASQSHRQPAAALVLETADLYVSENYNLLRSEQIDIWPVNDHARKNLTNVGLGQCLVPLAATQKIHQALGRYSVVVDLAADQNQVWRILEAGISRAAVTVNADSLSRIPGDLHDYVHVIQQPDEFGPSLVAHLCQQELRDREATRLARQIHRSYTFRHRVNQIAAATGIALNQDDRTVSVITPTNRPHQLSNIINNVARQEYLRGGKVELILVLHGLERKPSEVAATARDVGLENVIVIAADHSVTLGTCLNLGIKAASGHYIAKMDDDNFYGRHYLTDLLAAFDYSGADIVGKWAHYVWLRSSGAVILRSARSEHQRVRLVQGGSIVMTRDVAHSLGFSDLPRGVDTDLLNRAYASDLVTYSADRFNYVSIRSSDRTSHTWNIADTALMNRAGSIVFYGDPRDHVEV